MTDRLGMFLVNHDGLRHLVADGEHRVQGGHRVLDDQRELSATDLVHLAIGQLQEVLAVQRDASGDDAARRRGDEAHQCQHCHRLAGPRFSNDSQGLAAAEVEADAVDGFDGAKASLEVSSKVIHLQDHFLCDCCFCSHIVRCPPPVGGWFTLSVAGAGQACRGASRRRDSATLLSA